MRLSFWLGAVVVHLAFSLTVPLWFFHNPHIQETGKRRCVGRKTSRLRRRCFAKESGLE